MWQSIQHYLFMFLLISVISSCAPASTTEPTASPSPESTATTTSTITPTLTPTHTETPSPTATVTPIPFTPTPTIAPGLVTGTILLYSDDYSPFVTTIEIRSSQSFQLIVRTNTDQTGTFEFSGITEGKYELWILLNLRSSLLPGCSDVYAEDSGWGIGVKFGEDKAMTMERGSMENAILLLDNLNTPSLVANGIYAVTEFDVDAEYGAIIEGAIICQ